LPYNKIDPARRDIYFYASQSDMLAFASGIYPLNIMVFGTNLAFHNQGVHKDVPYSQNLPFVSINIKN